MGSIDRSSKALSLPILSLNSPTLTTDLYAACRDHGYFYLTDHGIPVSTLDQIVNLARRFFLESSESEKQQIKRETVENGGDGARGYQVLNENVTKGLRDYQEAVDLYREWDGVDEKVESKPNTKYGFLKGPNLWPKHPPELKSVYEAYIEQCMEVCTKLIKAMGEALGLEGSETDTMLHATRKSFWVMRLIGYPPLQNGADEEGVSCGEHSDYGCITLLLADSTKRALQVQHKDGSWLNADPLHGAFVVNIGDMVEKWTNGEWKSTNHRVIHRGSGYRVSVPFFFEPDFDAEVKPLAKCVQRTGGVVKYESTVYGKHLMGKVKANFS